MSCGSLKSYVSIALHRASWKEIGQEMGNAMGFSRMSRKHGILYKQALCEATHAIALRDLISWQDSHWHAINHKEDIVG